MKHNLEIIKINGFKNSGFSSIEDYYNYFFKSLNIPFTKDHTYFLLEADYTFVNNCLYRRAKGEIFFTNEKWYNHSNSIDIICNCGNDNFTLSYGNYEIFAKCTECDLEDSVYSG